MLYARLAGRARWFKRIWKEPLDHADATRLRTEQLSAVLRYTPVMMMANACNALVLMVAFWGTSSQASVLFWGATLFSVVGFICFRRCLPRAAQKSTARRLHRMRAAFFNALALGTCWAAVPLFFFQDAAPGVRLLIACLSAGMLCGGTFALTSIPFAAIAFTGPIAAASFATLAQSGGEDYLLVAIVLGVYTLVLIWGSFSYSEQLKTRILMQIDTEKQAQTDALTSLPNRLRFQGAIEREFARTARLGEGFLLICVDLNDFKLVNDRLGHLAGDELLVQVAKRMQACCRPSDLVARLGGDEFAIIVTGVKTRNDAFVSAQRFLECFQRPFVIAGNVILSSASLGAALAPQSGDDPTTLLRNADIALYQAKEQNGGAFHLFESTRDANAHVNTQKLGCASSDFVRQRAAQKRVQGAFLPHLRPLQSANLSAPNGGSACAKRTQPGKARTMTASSQAGATSPTTDQEIHSDLV
ncbi:MAG: diguanylate cyclase, partial [Methylocystis sp.]